MSRRSTLFLGPLSTILALLLMIALPQPAQAYTQRVRVTVARSTLAVAGSYCVQATAGIDHLTPGVWSANQAWGTAYALEADCVTPKVMRARIGLEVQRWNGSEWHYCIGLLGDNGWHEGTTGTDAWGPTGPSSQFTYYIGATYPDGSTAYCGGPGFYRAEVHAQVSVWDPFAARYIWTGGTLFSGDEWVG
ncbi:hypothetical protein [Microbispora bryophytorum]|uniref:DUF1036 domain-containing protein n=1 Tax=Microbispora bryophytorum TaxID=1460882 RepID=A0A8H9H1B4_9ACTN|nr:hypothetical protein [Microbispora bryophytorum]MBD3136587.1 hypothetical protein [Microbispora bryophytorum]TQS06180.1 hypothetical protein FLX07_14055 [Microbispora bryophytorum]GGO18137.1 hypothetical protein GCM10011574_42510 [Microbispora bryophytorum]